MKLEFITLCVWFLVAALPAGAVASDARHSGRDRAISDTLADLETEPIVVSPVTVEIDPYAGTRTRAPRAVRREQPADEPSFSVGADIGYLNGYTVYNFFNKRSELLYPLNNWMVRPSARYQADRVAVMISVMTALENDSGNKMHDRDWLDHGDLLISDTISQSSMDALVLDACVRYDFFRTTLAEDLDQYVLAEGDAVTLGALLGYAYQRFDYDIYDVYYQTDLVTGLAGTTQLAGTRVLTYQVEYHMPYIGLAGDVARGNWGLGADIKYSFCPTAKHEDNHLMRASPTGEGTLTLLSEYDDGRAWLGSVRGFWRFRPSWKATYGFDFTAAELDGDHRDTTNDPGWNTCVSTELYHGFLWGGLEFTF